jgi:hypothetical protein
MPEQFTEGNEFLIEFLKDKQYIYLTSVTHEFCEMTLNWFLSLKNIGSSHLALVVCLDQKSYKFMLSCNIPCVYLNCDIESNDTGEHWIENEKKYKLIGLYIIYKKHDVDCILSDVDIIFLKDPIDKIKSELSAEWDWVVMSDKEYNSFLPSRKRNRDVEVSENKTEIFDCGPTAQSLYGEQNGGFSYIYNYSTSKKLGRNPEKDVADRLQFMKNFHKNSDYYKKFPTCTESGCLQTIVNQKTKELKLNIKILSCFEFVNGSVWKVPYLREKIKNSCYLIHYNFCSFLDPHKVLKEKIIRMKEFNHWYI